jgi:hypothetical protein
MLLHSEFISRLDIHVQGSSILLIKDFPRQTNFTGYKATLIFSGKSVIIDEPTFQSTTPCSGEEVTTNALYLCNDDTLWTS